MLGMKEHPQAYVDECRARVERDLKALGKLPAAARSDIEAPYPNNLLLAMQHVFEHRLRTSGLTALRPSWTGGRCRT